MPVEAESKDGKSFFSRLPDKKVRPGLARVVCQNTRPPFAQRTPGADYRVAMAMPAGHVEKMTPALSPE